MKTRKRILLGIINKIRKKNTFIRTMAGMMAGLLLFGGIADVLDRM